MLLDRGIANRAQNFKHVLLESKNPKVSKQVKCAEEPF